MWRAQRNGEGPIPLLPVAVYCSLFAGRFTIYDSRVTALHCLQIHDLRHYKLFVVIEAFQDVADVVNRFKATTEAKLHHLVA